MEIKIEHRPSYALAVVKLLPQEKILAEAGAMVTMSESVEIATGMMGGLPRALFRKLFGGESLFTNTFTAANHPGEVTLAPDLPGDIERLSLVGNSLVVQAGSFLAASGELEVKPRFMGCRGFFGGEGFFMLNVSGMGELLLSSYGGIVEMDVSGTEIIDTSHIVAFEPSLEWHIKRVGGWKSFFFSGEGLVAEFSGNGKVWIQTRTRPGFLSWIIPFLPA